MKIIRPEEFPAGVPPGPHIVGVITCGDINKPNIIPLSNHGLLSSSLAYVGIRRTAFSNQLIRNNGKFAINYVDAKYVKDVDFCGRFSGFNTNKFDKTKFTLDKEEDIPLISEAAVSIKCKVQNIIPMKNHDIFVGEVISAKRRDKNVDWLYFDDFTYYNKKGPIGYLFECD